MPKVFKCPYCDAPPMRMQSNAQTCGSDKCRKRNQRAKQKEAKGGKNNTRT